MRLAGWTRRDFKIRYDKFKPPVGKRCDGCDSLYKEGVDAFCCYSFNCYIYHGEKDGQCIETFGE